MIPLTREEATSEDALNLWNTPSSNKDPEWEDWEEFRSSHND